jgi:hypothetical protein
LQSFHVDKRLILRTIDPERVDFKSNSMINRSNPGRIRNAFFVQPMGRFCMCKVPLSHAVRLQ